MRKTHCLFLDPRMTLFLCVNLQNTISLHDFKYWGTIILNKGTMYWFEKLKLTLWASWWTFWSRSWAFSCNSCIDLLWAARSWRNLSWLASSRSLMRVLVLLDSSTGLCAPDTVVLHFSSAFSDSSWYFLTFWNWSISLTRQILQ